MHDRRDRTSWAFPPNLAPSIPYADSSGVPACHPPPSSHMLSPVAHVLLPSLQYHQHSHPRLLSASNISLTLQSSLRAAPSNHDCTEEQHRVHQHLQHQEYLTRPLASLPPSFSMMTETWFGLIQTPKDAYLLLEACRIGMLYRITRRLTDLERSQIIRPGAVFVWEEKEAGIKRWTDHVRWSPSRVSGAFLIYSELLSASSRDPHTHLSDPLLKQSFSSTTLDGDRLHLIAYYSKSALDSGQLPTPTVDERLRSIVVPPGIYPDHRATGGVEGSPSRDHPRSNPAPRQPVGSFDTPHSVPSSNSLDSATSSLDTPHLHPATPTHIEGKVAHHRPSLSGASHPHPTYLFGCPKDFSELKYGNTSNYYSSSFYPSAAGFTDGQPLPSESTRWDSFPPNMPSWDSARIKSAVTCEAPSYPNTSTPTTCPSVLTSPNLPNLPSLGIWKEEQARDKTERRFSAPIIQPPIPPAPFSGSGHNHGYHPYARLPDRERMSKDRRMDGKSKDSRAFSYESTTAPGSPLTPAYPLPGRSDDTLPSGTQAEPNPSITHSRLERNAGMPLAPSSTQRQMNASGQLLHVPCSSNQTPPTICVAIPRNSNEFSTYSQAGSTVNHSSLFSQQYSPGKLSPSLMNRRVQAEPSQSPQRNSRECVENADRCLNQREFSAGSDATSTSNLLPSRPDTSEDIEASFRSQESMP